MVTGCLGPRSRAERVELAASPLRDARTGELCRYKARREGAPGEPAVEEEWTLRVGQVVGGAAEVFVEVLGPSRTPPAPSPREPGWSVLLQSKSEGFSGSQILRLFHRPDLSPRGVRAYLDEEVGGVDGSMREFPLVVDGKTCAARELTIQIRDATLERGTYRLVVVDGLPVCGIYEADLDEVWISDAPDGERHEERRHDHLELADWKR
jgi:hypothetical protein